MIDANITLINDSIDFKRLPKTRVVCEISYQNHTLASQTIAFESLKYYQTATQKLSLKLPKALPESRINARLVVRVETENVSVSQNEYAIVLAQRSWSFNTSETSTRKYYILKDDQESAELLASYNLKFTTISNVSGLFDYDGVFVLSGLKNVPP